MVSSHFYLNESTEIITSRNFRHGRRTGEKGVGPLSVLSCVQTKKDLMFEFLFSFPFLFSFFFRNVLYFMWKGIIIVFSSFFLARSEKRFVMGRGEGEAIYSCVLVTINL
jgi:hypothetical protein